LRLLLLLSALIAGMTGLIAGPAAAREPAAIASVLVGGDEQARPAAAARHLPQMGEARAVTVRRPLPRADSAPAQTHPVNERRNE
jgi:hypothetical protein